MRHKIIVVADHAGFALKEKISIWLSKMGYTVIDIGAPAYKKNDDYPLYAKEGARAVLDTAQSIGVFFCGSGVGISVVANRFKGIRAVHAESVATVKRARKEDYVNVLVLGARIVSETKAKRLVNTFLMTQPSKEPRHLRRIKLIDAIT